MSLLLALQGGGLPEGDAQSSGTATVSGVGAAIWNVVASSAGIGTATGSAATIRAANASSSGAGTATGISQAIAGVVGNAAGSATALFAGDSVGGEAPPVVPIITGWAGGHHWRRKRRKTIEEILADVLEEIRPQPVPKLARSRRQKARENVELRRWVSDLQERVAAEALAQELEYSNAVLDRAIKRRLEDDEAMTLLLLSHYH